MFLKKNALQLYTRPLKVTFTWPFATPAPSPQKTKILKPPNPKNKFKSIHCFLLSRMDTAFCSMSPGIDCPATLNIIQ